MGFPEIRLCHTPKNWNFGKISRRVFWDLPIRVKSLFSYNKSLSHNAEYKNKLTDDFFLLLAWISVFSSGHPHCKTCHSSDGNENNFRSAVQANSQSQYLHRIEVSRIFPSNLRKTNRFFIKDGLQCSDFRPGKNLKIWNMIKWGASFRWKSSLYSRMRNYKRPLTNTHPTLAM